MVAVVEVVVAAVVEVVVENVVGVVVVGVVVVVDVNVVVAGAYFNKISCSNFSISFLFSQKNIF